jgi:hypothetical protein
MAQILQFIGPGVTLDADATALVSAAYDQAIRALHDKGQPALVREIIAKRIIALAQRGERNPEKLCMAALAEFGIANR